MKKEVKLISYEDLVKKHYILQVKKINPFTAKKSFYPYEGFGIECDKGWYNLLDRLCTDIETVLDKNKKLKKIFFVAQIKEKFGGLSFYTYSGSDEMWDLIEKAEQESYHICEKCGNKGKLRTKNPGWCRTLCVKCEKAYQKRVRY